MNSSSETNIDQALTSWRAAVEQWKDKESEPDKCHPWSERDYQRRLKTFTMLSEYANGKDVELAAAGFEVLPDGVLGCALCKVKFDQGMDRPSHDPRCGWKNRPYAELKSLYSTKNNTNDNVFDQTRDALSTLERISATMRSIRAVNERSG